MSETHPLEPDLAERASWLAAATDHVQAMLAALAHAPASGRTGVGKLDPAIVEEARPLKDALDWLGEARSYGLQPAGPGYLAYVPGGGLFAAAVASFVSLAMNRFTALANASPVLARLEHTVIDFLAAELGLPATTAGYLPSGGSLANFTAIVTARVARLGEDGDLRFAVIYTSREAHRSVMKAARLAGIPPSNVREIAVDDRLRMDVVALEAQLRSDYGTGMRPFLVVASAGTTNVGAIDPLAAIADRCAELGLWLHVDAAYGGAFALTQEGRTKLAGIERADSITLDPHKGFFLPYGTGCLLVRDGAALKHAHAESASYLQDLASDTSTRSAAEYGPELSRNDRGILLWLPLWLHGAAAFRAALQEKLALARVLREGLRELPIEVPLEPELSIVTFRAPRREGERLAEWNVRNRALLDHVNASARVYLSSTLLPTAIGPAFTLRACVLSFRTHEAHIQHALEDIARALKAQDHPGR